jgi:hypothetical protein
LTSPPSAIEFNDAAALLVGVRWLTACIRSSTRPSSRRMDVINDTFEMALALATTAS